MHTCVGHAATRRIYNASANVQFTSCVNVYSVDPTLIVVQLWQCKVTFWEYKRILFGLNYDCLATATNQKGNRKWKRQNKFSFSVIFAHCTTNLPLTTSNSTPQVTNWLSQKDQLPSVTYRSGENFRWRNEASRNTNHQSNETGMDFFRIISNSSKKSFSISGYE